MRVLHVIPGVAPRYGGPSTAIWPMVAALNRLPGVSAEVATTDADGPRGRFSPQSLPAGVVTHLFHRTFSERWKFSAGLGHWLKRYASEYDLLHVHALWTFSTLAACAAGRRRQVPIVLRPCGMLSPYTLGRSAWVKRLYWAAVERRNLASVCCFHVTSRAEAGELACLGPRAAPGVVIPLGIDPHAWQAEPRPDVLRRRCGPRVGDRPLVLFLSRLHPKKGVVDFLLPAFARLKADAFLAIAGGPDEHAPDHEAEVRAAVDRLGLADRVALLGPVSAAERWSLFDGAALFVLPSRSENFGIVVAEAMARGLPVVVSPEVQAAEHVTAAGAGRVVPLEADALAAALDELLAHPATGRALGERGRQYVRDALRWEQVAAQIAAMYRTCLAGAPPRANGGTQV